MRDSMKAIVVEKKDGRIEPRVGTLSTGDLPAGEVVLRVGHTALNYSDGAFMFGRFGEPPSFPHVPGIDFVGVVEKSSNPSIPLGKTYMHTSYGVGYERWGGMAEYAVSNGAWLIEKPEHLTEAAMMGLGTVGLTAMLAIEALERNGVTPDHGPVLVTGASGGVGSLATQLLTKLGYEVTASTGKLQAVEQLEALGARRVISRDQLLTMTSPSWAGVVDCVAGPTLKKAIELTRFGGSVAITGVASGFGLGLESVEPFVMRAISLSGVNTVTYPEAPRRAAWERIFRLVSEEDVRKSLRFATFEELPSLGAKILEGKTAGRLVIPVGGRS
jgi:acrylyl-CoA reductase (NADPH)